MMRRTLLAPPTGGRSIVSSRLVRGLLPVTILGAALALSGCETQSPMQTRFPYVPSDGVPVDLGAVQLRDLVVISSGKGKPGVLVASVSNSGNSEEQIGFASSSTQQVYTSSPAHSVQTLSGKTPVELPNMPVAPGDVVRLTVETPAAPAVVVYVPVLLPTGYYATISPTDVPSATATSSPSVTSAPSAKSSATPTSSASPTTTP
ncbi:MAG TPA: hypothetical protein VGN48_16490 [Pedococcus sp.]|nr:hypothetical protein [Pedococcus sp.]